jgi:hypothetical protein
MVTKFAIGIETKSGLDGDRSAAPGVAARNEPPQPPPSPATKLGFAFEWSLPLSARTEQ